MICCGQPRGTRYCPECGKELYQPGPLHDLLRHVEKTARAHRLWLSRHDKTTRDATAPAWHQRSLAIHAKRLRLANRWEGYASALRELMQKGPPPGGGSGGGRVRSE